MGVCFVYPRFVRCRTRPELYELDSVGQHRGAGCAGGGGSTRQGKTEQRYLLYLCVQYLPTKYFCFLTRPQPERERERGCGVHGEDLPDMGHFYSWKFWGVGPLAGFARALPYAVT